MSAMPLDGLSVLVTRPAHQADALVAAIETAGGEAYRFPVFDVIPRATDELTGELDAARNADVLIFVSANAVQHGLAVLGETRATVAAIGPATAAALEDAGRRVDIRPAGGFNSEHLLMEPALNDVGGKSIAIVRGETGRELLAETLRHRGASVSYLSAYATRPHEFSAEDLAALDDALAADRIGAVTIMSVATFEHLADILPAESLDRLAGRRLVAPGGRVIQTLAERLPGALCVEAPGPGAEAMVGALIASLEDDPGQDEYANDG